MSAKIWDTGFDWSEEVIGEVFTMRTSISATATTGTTPIPDDHVVEQQRSTASKTPKCTLLSIYEEKKDCAGSIDPSEVSNLEIEKSGRYLRKRNAGNSFPQSRTNPDTTQTEVAKKPLTRVDDALNSNRSDDEQNIHSNLIIGNHFSLEYPAYEHLEVVNLGKEKFGFKRNLDMHMNSKFPSKSPRETPLVSETTNQEPQNQGVGEDQTVKFTIETTSDDGNNNTKYADTCISFGWNSERKSNERTEEETSKEHDGMNNKPNIIETVRRMINSHIDENGPQNITDDGTENWTNRPKTREEIILGEKIKKMVSKHESKKQDDFQTLIQRMRDEYMSREGQLRGASEVGLRNSVSSRYATHASYITPKLQENLLRCASYGYLTLRSYGLKGKPKK